MKAKHNRDIISAVVPFEPANFVLIPGGQFTMGNTEGEDHHQNGEIDHQVQVSNFSISKYAVTVAEYRRFVDASGYQTDFEKDRCSQSITNVELKASDRETLHRKVSGRVRLQSKENYPVVQVSWHDAVAYSEWLSTKTGKQFRLPTEAEREYACQNPIPSTQYPIPSTQYPIPNTQYPIPNTQYC